MSGKGKMNRRKFLRMSAAGAATAGVSAFILNAGNIFNPESNTLNAKKEFLRCGT
ncbi:twin-arginine translocation signal domain-containing protein [candidate division CSSED10-310 bacterium]|uniref:Twin-arginine translocation signal domain-containing protein n=1 Tax=candidate division CSSED10-310 bacterium TaxID=2855610 RepID=A0ABV6YUK4_UNCC1